MTSGSSVQAMKKKNFEESNLRPTDLRSDALPLSHKDTSVSEVYYEVFITRVQHTARIINVDSRHRLIYRLIYRLILHRAQNLPSLLFLSKTLRYRQVKIIN